MCLISISSASGDAVARLLKETGLRRICCLMKVARRRLKIVSLPAKYKPREQQLPATLRLFQLLAFCVCAHATKSVCAVHPKSISHRVCVFAVRRRLCSLMMLESGVFFALAHKHTHVHYFNYLREKQVQFTAEEKLRDSALALLFPP